MATTEVFVKCAVGYEVRCEATAELGNATVGLGSGVFVRSNNRWGGDVPDDFRVRFARGVRPRGAGLGRRRPGVAR